MLLRLLDTVRSMSDDMYMDTVWDDRSAAIRFFERASKNAAVRKRPYGGKKSKSCVSRPDLTCMLQLLQYAAITNSWRLLVW